MPNPNTVFQSEIQKLVEEQKYQVALEKTEAYLKSKKAENEDFDYARALIKKMQLQLGLHGYETAAKELKKSTWPKDPLALALVNLYYGFSLINYYNSYSWEINQREEVISSKEVDLKKWSKDQIDEQIHKAFYVVWLQKEALGELEIKDFPEFFKVNNYPEGIRPTLRDTVTYLWVAHLSNSNFWSPKESNTTAFYNLESLLNAEIKIKKSQLPTQKKTSH